MKLIAAQIAILALSNIASYAEERHETFDADPGWEGVNNRSTNLPPGEVQQDFGWHNGRLGGTVMPDGSPAYYGKELQPFSFNDKLHASGSIHVKKGAGHTLLGFFNSGTVNEWRTPNSIVFRINGRGDTFHVHFEYATSKWRAGAGVIGRHDFEADRVHPIEQPGDATYPWTLSYDPGPADGDGIITATFGETTATCAVTAAMKADGATFNRFGLLNVVKSFDGGGELWVDDLRVLGQEIDLTTDPGWDQLRNRASYTSEEVRPRFNFGYSATNHAGGTNPGEIGGLHFRGDCRYPERMACYGVKTETLSMERPLKASGRVVLRRGVSDSTTYFGFYHSAHSMYSNPAQNSGLPQDVLGFAIEGPSSEGFYFYPVWRAHGEVQCGSGMGYGPPRIYPDGDSHAWTLEYTPGSKREDGKLALSLDEMSCEIPVGAEAMESPGAFDRFGFVTAWIDGNAQHVFIDDVHYTVRQDR